jgi:hypothetical protein
MRGQEEKHAYALNKMSVPKILTLFIPEILSHRVRLKQTASTPHVHGREYNIGASGAQ